jgi:betaine lipid synthase
LAYFVVGSERFLWKALGVPSEQRAMIEEDYKLERDRNYTKTSLLSGQKTGVRGPISNNAPQGGHAIWNYGVQTLDPVVSHTLVSEDNHYYLLCLLGMTTAF